MAVALLPQCDQKAAQYLTYPTGQNVSLELMFAKFATTKNREKLNPLKVSSQGRYLQENNTEDVKTAPPLGLEPPAFEF